jgi:ABC-type multidrug transport system fused ATPase/permease subunit
MALVAESTRLVRSLSRSLSEDVSTSQRVSKGVNVGRRAGGLRISSKRRGGGVVAALTGGDREVVESFGVRRTSSVRAAAVRTAVEEEVPLFMLEEAFEKDSFAKDSEKSGSNSEGKESKKENKKKDKAGASTVLSGVKLENISKTYKNATVLKDVSWEVKRGERVGLVGINGAGKTTQLNIIAGKEEPDSGNVVKARSNMKIAFLSQEFEVVGSRTLREEFMSTFASEMEISARMEKVQVVVAFFHLNGS